MATQEREVIDLGRRLALTAIEHKAPIEYLSARGSALAAVGPGAVDETYRRAMALAMEWITQSRTLCDHFFVAHDRGSAR